MVFHVRDAFLIQRVQVLEARLSLRAAFFDQKLRRREIKGAVGGNQFGVQRRPFFVFGGSGVNIVADQRENASRFGLAP